MTLAGGDRVRRARWTNRGASPPIKIRILTEKDEIEPVKNSALELVDRLFLKIPDSRVALIDYRDFPPYPYGSFGDYPYNALLPFSDRVTDITGAINRLSLGHGEDWPESAYSALMNTLQGKNIGSWREEAEKAIILFTDTPPHDLEPSTAYTLDSVIAAMRSPVTIQSPLLARSAPLSIASSPLLQTNLTPKPVSIYSVVIDY